MNMDALDSFDVANAIENDEDAELVSVLNSGLTRPWEGYSKWTAWVPNIGVALCSGDNFATLWVFSPKLMEVKGNLGFHFGSIKMFPNILPLYWTTSILCTVLQYHEEDHCMVINTINGSRPCTKWEYDKSTYMYTIIEQWDLVCERENLKHLAQSAFFAGMMIGVTVAGSISDRWGRKATLVPANMAMVLVGSLTAFSPNIETFMALRFVQALFTVGTFALSFVWCMEVVGGNWQTYVGVGMQLPWVVSWMYLSLLGYYIPEWRWLQLATTAPGIVCLALFWVLPESPKWLLSVGRLTQAEEILREAAATNGKPLPPTWKLIPVWKNEEKEQPKANLLDLFKSPVLLKHTLVLYVNWFATSFVYYGLTLNSGNLGGSHLMTFFINGVLELPSYVLIMLILLKGGRKRPFIALIIMGSIFLLLTLAIPRDFFADNWPIVALAMAGKFCVTGCFGIIYVYSAELFPTVVRSVGVGSSSTFARVGGILAPFVGSLDKVVDPTFPIAIFGLTSLIAGCLVFLLPETKDIKLPDTLDEASEWKKKTTKICLENSSQEDCLEEQESLRMNV